MKKLISLLLAVLLCMNFCACGREKTPAAEPESPIEETAPVTAPPVEKPIETEAPVAPEETPEEPVEGPLTEGEEKGLRPEFKAAMDSYEAFYDDYCALLKRYMENPSDLSILSEYMGMLGKLADMDEAFDAWESTDLNNEELKYYLEVTARIEKKLIDLM